MPSFVAPRTLRVRAPRHRLRRIRLCSREGANGVRKCILSSSLASCESTTFAEGMAGEVLVAKQRVGTPVLSIHHVSWADFRRVVVVVNVVVDGDGDGDVNGSAVSGERPSASVLRPVASADIRDGTERETPHFWSVRCSWSSPSPSPSTTTTTFTTTTTTTLRPPGGGPGGGLSKCMNGRSTPAPHGTILRRRRRSRRGVRLL